MVANELLRPHCSNPRTPKIPGLSFDDASAVLSQARCIALLILIPTSGRHFKGRVRTSAVFVAATGRPSLTCEGAVIVLVQPLAQRLAVVHVACLHQHHRVGQRHKAEGARHLHSRQHGFEVEV